MFSSSLSPYALLALMPISQVRPSFLSSWDYALAEVPSLSSRDSVKRFTTVSLLWPNMALESQERRPLFSPLDFPVLQLRLGPLVNE